ncbi:MAG: YdcF family protein [Leptolyngbya sp. IPPAS B-1204]|nr:YdcF family protein [Elainella sp. C42_A2020_010]RNJ67344.1 MAG: YdcF family protein [Leptolyngbya sp. IPPAS B-1204]
MDGLTAMIAMVDPASCGDSPAGGWAFLTWQLFNGVTNPSLVLPILASLILLPWFVKALPWKRQISGLGMVLLLLYGLLCSPLGIQLGNRALQAFLPSDSGEAADAIVVLGRGSEMRLERTQVAAELWRAGRAPLVFASGWGDAQPIVSLLSQMGLPSQAVDGEPCSRTTEENARFTAARLQPAVQQIVLVTDPPHMLRSYLTFRSLGFRVIPHTNPLPAQLPPRKEAFLLVREYLGLASYSALGRFSPRQTQPALVGSFKF